MNKKKKILYISSNDGSDMRINKELKTLSGKFEITYVGVGLSNADCYAREYCKLFYLIIGRRNHPLTILKQLILVIRLMRMKFSSIHIINEQLMIFFYPLLFKNYIVLDIFDSIFLRLNKSKNKWKLLKDIIYGPVNVILVTDQNRKTLMPDSSQTKIRILENYPNKYLNPIKKRNVDDTVVILYNGGLGKYRGTDLVEKILALNRNVKIIMAGWFADNHSMELANHPQVDYRGIMLQDEALQIAADEADYILCVYAPTNENNINASPNKIYDSIQTKTPVIINAEVKISSFVRKHNIGLIIENYKMEDIQSLIDRMFEKKNSYLFSDELIQTYTWENIEDVLINAHDI